MLLKLWFPNLLGGFCEFIVDTSTESTDDSIDREKDWSEFRIFVCREVSDSSNLDKSFDCGIFFDSSLTRRLRRYINAPTSKSKTSAPTESPMIRFKLLEFFFSFTDPDISWINIIAIV